VGAGYADVGELSYEIRLKKFMVQMKKKYIHIYQCKPGDILTEDLYDDCGILIVSKNSIITERELKRLKIFRIRQLSVYEANNLVNTENAGHFSPYQEV
jgi:hypothetical protein